MEQNWRDLTYLLQGTPRQKAAYNVFDAIALFPKLSAFDPILTGDPYQTLWHLSYLSPEKLYSTIFNKT